MNIIFYDTETTGVPKNYKAPLSDLDNWPRVIQLAYIVYNEEGEKLKEFSALIKPDGWEIPKEKFWIDNGFDTESSNLYGIPMSVALAQFKADFESAGLRVCHNVPFDSAIMGAEFIRNSDDVNTREKTLCTMAKTTSWCKLPSPYGGFKWPKLQELHVKLFGSEFEAAHDALADVTATAKCFFECIKRGIFSYEIK